MKFFWGLLLLATVVVSDRALEARRIRELSESDIDIIKKSKEIKEALEVEHREPTEEEHAVLAQWEQIFANKQDELKAAGIIDRRASAPVDRFKRAKRLGKDVDRTPKKNIVRETDWYRRAEEEKRELSNDDQHILQKLKEIAVSEEDKAVIQKLEEIALTIDAEDRDPTPEELAVLGKAQQIVAGSNIAFD